jgi:hypothetical protein
MNPSFAGMILWGFVSGFFACITLTVYLDRTLHWRRYAAVSVATGVVAICNALGAIC